MIAVDTSVIIPPLAGATYPETDRLAEWLALDQATITPVTLTELLSDPSGSAASADALTGLAVLSLREGYWERAGLHRASVRRAKRKAAMADALVAQACLDHDLPLLTRDTDSQSFAEIPGLKLAA